MAAFILLIIFLYRRKQILYQESLTRIAEDSKRNLLEAQLEIQEQTFQHISREIHDNINLSLTLAKLHLNTINWVNNVQIKEKIGFSIDLLSQSINDLSNISKGLNTDAIIDLGLIKALEFEAQRIRETNLFHVDFIVTGHPVYLDCKKELIIFRIVQESFNNIIKHGKATEADIRLHYFKGMLYITIADNGRGFNTETPIDNKHAGLRNMKSRVKLLNGSMKINSIPESGTKIYFNIPFE
jgi:signal transduction histidine kinase